MSVGCGGCRYSDRCTDVVIIMHAKNVNMYIYTTTIHGNSVTQ